MPLSMIGAGETVTIGKITGRDDVRQHLAELGFVVGETITALTQMSGNMILLVKNTRVALGRSMANRILVK